MKHHRKWKQILSAAMVTVMFASVIPPLGTQNVFSEDITPDKAWNFDTEDDTFIQNTSELMDGSPFGGKMLRINGTNVGAELEYPVNLSSSGTTFSMWIHPAKGSMIEKQSLLHQKRNRNLLSLEKNQTGRLVTYVTGENHFSDYSEVVREERWNHVAISMLPGRETTQIEIFINGKKVMSDICQGTPPNESAGFLIGKHKDAKAFFNGYIDNICYFAKALDEAEIAAVYSRDAVQLPEEPVITTDLPNFYAVNQGESITLEIEASVHDGGELSYRWYHDAIVLQEGTEKKLAITDIGPEQYGTYYVEVINSKNNAVTSITSGVCVLKDTAPPQPAKIWDFENIDGNDIKDHNQNVIGSLENGAVTAESDFGERALYLDGTTWAKLDGTYRFSDTPGAWSMWIYPDVASFDIQMFKKRKVLLHPENTKNFLSIASHSEGGLLYTYITGEAKTGSTEAMMKAGHWNHIAITTDPVKEKLALYVNGVCVLAQTAKDFPDADSGFYVGRHRLDDTDDFFTGLIDNIYYYDKALDDNDISSLYKSQMTAAIAKDLLAEEKKHWDTIKNERIGAALYREIEAFIKAEIESVLSEDDVAVDTCLSLVNQLKERTGRYEILIDIDTRYQALRNQVDMIYESSYYEQDAVKEQLEQIEPALQEMKQFLGNVTGDISKEALQGKRDEMTRLQEAVDRLHITIIKVDTSNKGNAFTKALFGANHRYSASEPDLKLPLNGYGMWDYENDRVRPQFQTQLNEANLGTIRFPGGTCANLYQWKRAIGPKENRIPTIHGQIRSQIGMPSEFGIDEAARMCEEAGSEMVYMYNMANGNVEDMLDLVEYLNAPATPEYPWAMERAENGHPEPYGVTRFEMGNEMNLSSQNYWTVLSDKKGDTYARGGLIAFQGTWNDNELDQEKNKPYLVVKQTDWTNDASLGDGTPNQVRYFRYHPVVEGSAKVFVDNTMWNIVDSLEGQGKRNVCTVDYQTGEIRFGDGVDGNIPASGAKIRTKYTADIDGFADYAKAMHEFADELGISIEVYSCFDGEWFLKAMKNDFPDVPWEGIAVHPYGGRSNRDGSNEYFHDLLMGDVALRVQKVQEHVDSLRAYFPDKKICVSECGVYGSNAKYKWWINAAGNGLWLAKLMLGYSKIEGVSYACRHCLVDNPGRQDTVSAGETGAISIYYNYDEAGKPESIAGITSTPSLLTMEMLNTFYGTQNVQAEGFSVPTMVSENIQQEVADIPVLDIYASTDDEGYTYLAVVNGSRVDNVTALVSLDETSKLPTAQVMTMECPSYDSVNDLENPNTVQLVPSEITDLSGKDHFSYTFAPLSFTIIKVKTEGEALEGEPVSKIEIDVPEAVEAGVRFTAKASVSPINAEHVAASWKIVDGRDCAEVYENSGLVQTYKEGTIKIAAVVGGVESEPATVKIKEPLPENLDFNIESAVVEDHMVKSVILAGEKKDSVLYAASYYEGALKELKKRSITPETGDTVPVDLDIEGADKIMVFLWDKDMKPIDKYILQ